MSRFLLLAVTAILANSAACFADWPLFRGDPLMTGVGSAKLPEQLEERWTFKAGDTIEGSPAVVDGVVYVASLDKHLYALDLTTGKLKWKVKLGPAKASPSYKAGRIYLGDLDGKFFCVNAADGKVVWTFEAEAEIQASANFHGDNIIFGSHDSALYCLNPNGKKVWDLKVDGPINAAAAVVGDRTFATGCSDGILHVVNATNGKEFGTIDLGGQAVATAAVVGDRVYLSMVSNQVVAADWKTLKRVWAFEAPKRQMPFYSSAAVSNDLVISGSRDKKIYALNAKTGAEVWNFVTSDGNFYVLDLKTGKKLQELNLDSAVTGSVGVGPDCILVGTDKGTLYCLGKK
jgi:outer membrane protein assembly factor BamB